MKTIIKASIVLTGLCFAHSASADNCLQGCPTGLDNGNTIERSIYSLLLQIQSRMTGTPLNPMITPMHMQQ
ncbi:hypothetical protein AN391_01476 [Pseudoalteromonas sp. P1-13-1a]|uniref:Uncharacterized protein n=1 Tax=Pseudoalteromonas undina TaxID=43660 RepID=A0ACC6R6X9_9GAMM|nr:hypothetical protein AN391_01476 [Pseudoalteromonas sp. P1-13-1a]